MKSVGTFPQIKITARKLVFWDFDGVIKESIEVKSRAYAKLFQPYGIEVSERVRAHHGTHSGVSRFDKMPLYLEWIGEIVTPERVHEYCQRFSNLVRQGVIDAPWVPGAEIFLRNNRHGQVFVLVTATPQNEIEDILGALNLRFCFVAVYGAPMGKKDAIREVLSNRKISPQHCLMVGDSRADWDAARANGVPFLLRRHVNNGRWVECYTGDSIEDFMSL